MSQPSPAIEPARSRPPDPAQRYWTSAGLAFCGLMLCVHVAAGLNSAGIGDFWRDVYWATSIAHGERFPLAGPQIYQLIELGPWWFYLLALPMFATGSVAATAAFIQVLAALKYFLAWRIGTRLADARLGFTFAAGLALAGWSTIPLLFPSHTAVVGTAILLLGLVAWRCGAAFSGIDATWLGLASAACLHAHPTTATYVVGAALYVLWKRRSRAAFGWMAVAAGIAALSLLPPWLEPDTAVDATLKPVAAYLGTDLGVQPLLRIPGVVRSLVTGGAWWGFLLMTPWNVAGARIAWWISCACLLVAVAGLPRLLRRDRRLLGLAVAALLVFLAQVAFLVLLRPITPMWMVPSCLPPLALAIALGWYGWLADARAAVRRTAALLLCVQAGLALAPFSLLLRDIHALRVMPGVNPLYDVIERSDRRVEVAVPFYPVRRIDRLAAFLCRPLVLHARLAAVIEPTLGSPIRNACGHWPELRYGGVDGVGAHVAGLLAPAATASGIAPSRVVSRMAIYDRVRPIAPVAGGRWMPPRRLQIDPGSAAGPPRASEFDFDAAGADVVVLTNRLPNAAPMTIGRVTAGGSPARLLYDDGGSTLYRCAACAADASVHWQVDVRGIAGNLDLIVLPHAQDVSGAEPDR